MTSFFEERKYLGVSSMKYITPTEGGNQGYLYSILGGAGDGASGKKVR